MVVAGAWIDGTPRRSRGVVVCIAMAALATPMTARGDDPVRGVGRVVPVAHGRPLRSTDDLEVVAGRMGDRRGGVAHRDEHPVRGLVAAIRGAISTGHVGDGAVERLRQYLDLVDGPTIGSVATARLPWVGILVLVMCGCLAAIGCRGADRRAALLGVVGAACLGLCTSASWGDRYALPPARPRVRVHPDSARRDVALVGLGSGQGGERRARRADPVVERRDTCVGRSGGWPTQGGGPAHRRARGPAGEDAVFCALRRDVSPGRLRRGL